MTKEIIEDGQTIKVSMMLMDGVQAAVAADAVIFDAAGHRPGYVQLSDAERNRRTTLYQDYDNRLSERWRTPQPTANATGVKTGDARLDAYSNYQERIVSAWRHQ
jgi:hypothetical protein